jgi:predicted HD phosphohydrolase
LSCQGYSLKGDTLALANGSQTVLIRSAALHDLGQSDDPLD